MRVSFLTVELPECTDQVIDAASIQGAIIAASGRIDPSVVRLWSHRMGYCILYLEAERGALFIPEPHVVYSPGNFRYGYIITDSGCFRLF